MRRPDAWLLAGLVAGCAGVGCGGAPDASSVVIPSPVRGDAKVAASTAARLEDLPTAPPPGHVAAAAAIVWVEDEKLPLRTRSLWVETSSARAGAPAWVASTRDEPIAVAGEKLLAVRAENVASAPTSCECADCPGLEGDIERAVVVDLATGAATPITSVDADPAEAGVDARFRVHGLVGDVVFVEEHASLMMCDAAHPLFTDRAFAHDLVRGVEARVGPSASQLADAIASARDALREKRESCGFEDAFEPALYATHLAFDPGPVPRTTYRMTADVSYMCGTGPNHYSVEVEVVRGELPATHPSFAMPPWLSALLRESSVRGIAASIPADRIEALRKSFREAR